MKRYPHRVLGRIFGLLLILFALAVVGFFWLLKQSIDHLDVASWLPDDLPYHVQVDEQQIDWYGLGPTIHLNRIELHRKKTADPRLPSSVTLSDVHSRFELLKSLWHQRLFIKYLDLGAIEVTLALQQDDALLDRSLPATLFSQLFSKQKVRSFGIRELNVQAIQIDTPQHTLLKHAQLHLFALNRPWHLFDSQESVYHVDVTIPLQQLTHWLEQESLAGISRVDGHLHWNMVWKKEGEFYQGQKMSLALKDVQYRLDNHTWRINARLSGQHHRDALWTMTLERLILSHPDWKDWTFSPHTFAMDLDITEKACSFYGQALDLTPLLPWNPWPVDGVHHHQLQLSQYHVDLNWREHEDNPCQFKAAFSDLAVEHESMPGLLFNLSGEASGQPQQGQLAIQVNSQDHSTLFSGYGQGQLNWWYDHDQQALGWQLKDAVFNVSGFRVDFEGQQRARGPLSMQINYQHDSARQAVQAVLPWIEEPSLRMWLEQAFPSDDAVTGELLLRRTHAHQPIQVESRTRAKQLDFQFDSDWPVLRGADTTLHYHQGHLDIVAEGGRLKDVIVQKATSRLEPHQPIVQVPVEITTKMQLEHLIPMLLESPLEVDFKRLLGFRGQLDSRLSLQIPLDEASDLSILGHAQVTEAQLDLFNDGQLLIENFTGQLDLKHGLDVVDPAIRRVVPSDGDEAFSLRLSGRGQSSLHNVDESVLLLTHAANLKANVITRPDDSPLFYINFDLKQGGTEVPWLSPLVNQHLSRLRGSLIYTDDDFDVNIAADHDFHLDLQGSQEAVEQKNAQDWTLSGHLSYFDDQTMLSLLKFGLAHYGDLMTKDRRIALNHLSVDQLVWLGQNIGSVEVGMRSEIDGRSFSITGERVAGTFKCDHQGDNWWMHLQRLVLPDSSRGTLDGFSVDQVPNVRLLIDSLSYSEDRYQNIDLLLSARPKHINVDFLNISDSRFSVDGIASAPALHVFTDLSKVGHLWEHMGIQGMQSDAGHGEVRLSWAPELSYVLPQDLEGTLAFELKHVNLTIDQSKSHPIKNVLSLLNVNNIPKRLMLDFSDMRRHQHRFYKLSSKTDLAKGQAKIGHLLLKGTDSTMKMLGTVDLITKKADLTLEVVPKITAPLPLFVTILGTPVLGVATWFATNLIGDTVNQISTHRFTIKGDWDDLKIESEEPSSTP